MTEILLDWPDCWDGGPDVPECDLTDRYATTCVERWKVMRTAISNAHDTMDTTGLTALRNRFASSRSARIAAMTIALRASEETLAEFCIDFAEKLGSQPAPITQDEYDPEVHLLLNVLPNGKVVTLPYTMAVSMYADRLLIA